MRAASDMVWLAPRGLRFPFFKRTEMRPNRQADDAGIAPSFGPAPECTRVAGGMEFSKRTAMDSKLIKPVESRPGTNEAAPLQPGGLSSRLTVAGFMHGHSTHGVLPLIPSLPTSANGPGPAFKTTPLPSLSQCTMWQ